MKLQLFFLIEKIYFVDLFPITHHVETVAVLSRKSATKTFIPVTVSPKDMGLDEAKAQPTYENIRAYVKETHGLTVSTLNIAQMKAECGLEMACDRSGDKRQPKCPPEKREAILDAFRHFGMIEDDSSEGKDAVFCVLRRFKPVGVLRYPNGLFYAIKRL